MQIERLSAVISTIALTALTACTPMDGKTSAMTPEPKPTAARECFNADMVSNYAVVDKSTVNLRVGVKDYYQIKLLGSCPDIKWANGIALESAGSSVVCSGLDLTIITPSSVGRQTCPASSIRKLPPEEVATLPKGQKP